MQQKVSFRSGVQGAGLAILAGCVSCWFSGPAALAAEYCVTCEGPASMYACVVQGSAPDAPADPREQLICISELAKGGGHASCSVPRSAPSPCPGVLKIVAPPAELPPAPPAQMDAEGSQPSSDADGVDGGIGAANPNVAPQAKPKVPRTVEELAKETVKSSADGIKKAGEAVTGTAEKAGDQVKKAGSTVGSAAKKTWDCVVSLFNDC